MGLRAGVLVCLTLFSGVAQAAGALDPIPGEERFTAQAVDQTSTLGTQMGFARIDGDNFVQLNIKTELQFGKLGLGLQIPLNLRIDSQGGDYGGRIRREDWDQPGEFLRVIRFVRYGQKRDPVFVRVGELAADIGHSTIVRQYMNNTDINTFRVGAQLDINTRYGGIETMVGDVASLVSKQVQSKIVAGRAYLKPVGLLAADSPLNIFAVGFTVASDVNAPATFKTDAGGAVEHDGKELAVDTTRAATVYGLDVEAELVNNKVLQLVPYADFNRIQDAGRGLHAGVQAAVTLPVSFALRLPMRLEYRRFDANYVPTFFSTFYEIERLNYPLGAAGQPKAVYVRRLDKGEGLSGVFAEMAFDFAGVFQLGSIYEDYRGSDPYLTAFLNVPAFEVLQFKAYYQRAAIQGKNDIFKLDERSLAIAQARYQVMPYLFMVGRWSRRWVLDEQAASPKFVAKDDWRVGFETAMTF